MCAVLLEAAAAFTLSVGLHVVVWRIQRPIAYGQWLPRLVVIFLVAGPAFGGLLVQRGLVTVDAGRADGWTEWAAVMLLHGSVSTVYIIGYTLVSSFSPSIEILKLLERTPGGLLRSEVDLPLLRGALGSDRIGNLIEGGLIRAEGDSVHVGPRARALTGLVLFYRHLIGLPDGAGG
jgi:hypothetical protein